ncbi:MAG: DUF4333 domain-containing protein [Actinomycetota bacterium]|nr:DUF4333 domain-containing protein [Actinomycetota bacterium]
MRGSEQGLSRVLVLCALGLGMIGCSGTVVVAADDVASQISDQLEAEVGQRPDSVECPEDLPGEVGATMRCELTAGEDVLGVTVSVTEVDGATVNFDIEVDGN